MTPTDCMVRSDSSSIDTARGSCTVWGFCSMMRTSMPYRARRPARVSPVGPAPAIMTGQCSRVVIAPRISPKPYESTGSGMSDGGSGIDRALGDRQRRFLDGLAQRRVGMAGTRDILRRRAEFHGNRRLRDHGFGGGSEDVHAEHAI